MATNSDLKRWYKMFNVQSDDFVRYDDMFSILCYDATDDFHAVNLGQVKRLMSSASSVGNWKKVTGPIDMTSAAFNGKEGYYTIEFMVKNKISAGMITDGMEGVQIFTQDGISGQAEIQSKTFYYLSMPFKVEQGRPAAFYNVCNNKPVILVGPLLTCITQVGDGGGNAGYVSSISVTDESQGQANEVYYRINYDGNVE